MDKQLTSARASDEHPQPEFGSKAQSVAAGNSNLDEKADIASTFANDFGHVINQ